MLAATYATRRVSFMLHFNASVEDKSRSEKVLVGGLKERDDRKETGVLGSSGSKAASTG